MHIHSMRDRATHATYVQVRRAHAAYMNTRHVPHMHTEDAPKAVISPQKNTKDGVPAEHVWEEHRGLSDPPHQRPAGHSTEETQTHGPALTDGAQRPGGQAPGEKEGPCSGQPREEPRLRSPPRAVLRVTA